MKNGKKLLLLLFLILMVGLIGCSSSSSSGGSSGGGSTPPPAQTDTQKLVGTWTQTGGPLGTGNLVFNANGTGSWGSGFTNGSIDNGVLTMTFDSGVTEGFPITFSNNNNTITINNHGFDYTYNRV